MKSSDYLFPRDLKKSNTNLNTVLIIGSCLAEAYQIKFSEISPDTKFDYVLYNNFAELSEELPRDPSEYDLIYLQIPLRTVLSDAVVDVRNIFNSKFNEDIMNRAKYTIESMLEEGMKYNKLYGILTVVSNFIVQQQSASPSLNAIGSQNDLRAITAELNNYISNAVSQYNNAYLADIDAVASSIGKMHMLDDMIYFYSHNAIVNPIWGGQENNAHWTDPEPGRIERVPDFDQFYPIQFNEFFETAYAQLVHLFRVARQIDQVKVVIFDLDNTLWRGQIGDHYAAGQVPPHSDNWPLGIWEAVHHLKARGILVSLCSKNDPSFVEQNWDKAVNLPFLKLSDFLLPQISYGSKVDGVDRILKAFNLTAKSAVFVDDNPVERSAVLSAHPGIRVIGSNPFLTRRILLWSAETQTAKLTSESSSRDEMIRKQIARDVERSTYRREDFLRDLKAELTIIDVRNTQSEVFPRVFELLNRTNQFNTTGKRWDFKEIHEYLNGGGQILAFYVSDRFVDYGLVGIILHGTDQIVQYVMSCRVLGMDVEIAALRWLVNKMTADGADVVSGRIVETEANVPCRDVYRRAGFTASEEIPDTYATTAAEMLSPIEHIKITVNAAKSTALS